MPQDLVTLEQARATVLAQAKPLGEELVAVSAALDRVLAREIMAAGDVPPFACSAMDGYAIKAGAAGRLLDVVGESRAGAPAPGSVQTGQAIRISTGAAVPEGAEAVIRQEDVGEHQGQIRTEADSPPGINVRAAGEDLHRGRRVLAAGTRLGPAELGAAVGAGTGALAVARRPRVAVLSTGDELRAPGEPLGPGEIHNSNAPMLRSLAIRCGAEPLAAERLRDDFEQTRAGLAAALQGADVVVVSGGVSVGPHDHVKPALAALGVQELFWGVALQPGKPTWFGVSERPSGPAPGRQLVFGLPGNPVSCVVTFTLFVRPALAAMQGIAVKPSAGWTARLAVAVPRNPNRTQAIRVRLEHEDGSLLAVPNGPQGSHLVSSLLGADALAFVEAGAGECPAGQSVVLEPLLG